MGDGSKELEEKKLREKVKTGELRLEWLGLSCDDDSGGDGGGTQETTMCIMKLTLPFEKWIFSNHLQQVNRHSCRMERERERERQRHTAISGGDGERIERSML